jgi:hypothetical protein
MGIHFSGVERNTFNSCEAKTKHRSSGNSPTGDLSLNDQHPSFRLATTTRSVSTETDAVILEPSESRENLGAMADQEERSVVDAAQHSNGTQDAQPGSSPEGGNKFQHAISAWRSMSRCFDLGFSVGRLIVADRH